MNLGKLIIFPILALVLSCQSDPVDIPRERIPLDFDWKFMQSDIKGGEQEDFDDKSWRKLNIPHDWSIEGSYDETNETGTAGAFLPAGIGWYRKSIDIINLEEDDKDFVQKLEEVFFHDNEEMGRMLENLVY